MNVKVVKPSTIATPIGAYSHAFTLDTKSFSKISFISGQVANDIKGNLVGKGDFRAQYMLAYENLRNLLVSEGASFANIVQLRTFLTNYENIHKFFEIRKETYPKWFPNGNYPPNTLLVIDSLVWPDLLIEVEAIACW
ncbi:MAG: RidA family protein [Candidatus Tectomicrobia bacterium]|nr:RidA family protein [Candidatus Tectomicrobia bacterium]